MLYTPDTSTRKTEEYTKLLGCITAISGTSNISSTSMSVTRTTRVVWSSKLGELILEGRLLPFQKGVNLFNANRKWWLAYTGSIYHNTGPFKTKKAAIQWYEKGGR